MKIIIPIEPRTKKNSQRIIRVHGKPIIVPSKQYKDYEKACMGYIDDTDRKKIDYPVNVKCAFYMGTRRKCDLTNLLEAIDDILVKSEVLADDNYSIIESHDGSRVYYDNEFPRTVVEIRRLKDDRLRNIPKSKKNVPGRKKV